MSMARISSRWLLWYLPALGAVVVSGVFVAGFWLALRGGAGAPLGDPPPPPAKPKRIVPSSGQRLVLILGDSLARGTGDENGRGFAGDVEDFLRRRGKIELVNLGVNGAESDEVRQAAESPNVRTLAASADWILVSAGGNDISHAVPRSMGPSAQTIEEIDRARQRYLANLRLILSALREANATAPIYLIGLYDPFGEEGAAARIGASVILSWNTAAQETVLSFPRVFLVPTFDLFAGRPERLAGDHFHPNRKGYEAIAQRIEQLLPE
jgi:lysophospholipase L1-like esterase